MSFRRVFIWRCDHCQLERQREAFKLPEGWTLGDNLIQHFCNVCSKPYEARKDQKRGKLKQP